MDLQPLDGRPERRRSPRGLVMAEMDIVTFDAVEISYQRVTVFDLASNGVGLLLSGAEQPPDYFVLQLPTIGDVLLPVLCRTIRIRGNEDGRLFVAAEFRKIIVMPAHPFDLDPDVPTGPTS
jgi:hypothetical protein